MATIALYAGKINNMPSLIKDVKSSVKDLKSELTSFKNKCQSVNRNICNLDDVISSISTSTQTQEQKVTSLDNFSKDVEQFAVDVDRIDGNVADMINKNKDDFYNKYHYLKPDCEKGWLEKSWDDFKSGCTKAWEWCKDNWGSICNIILAVLAVVAIVALTIATFGTAAVAAILVAGAVGAVVGLAGQLISDVISFAITGEWTGTWQSYVGAILGGFAGGVMMVLTGGNVVLSCSADAMISTLFSESLENITGGQQRSMSEIWFDTALSGVTAAVCSKIFCKLTDKLSKSLSKNIPVLSRLAGRGSYEASFKMVITKLKTGTIKNFTIKTIRNGVISGLAGDFIKNITFGFGLDDFIEDGIKGIFKSENTAPSIKAITMPTIAPISQINFLPIRSY